MIRRRETPAERMHRQVAAMAAWYARNLCPRNDDGFRAIESRSLNALAQIRAEQGYNGPCRRVAL